MPHSRKCSESGRIYALWQVSKRCDKFLGGDDRMNICALRMLKRYFEEKNKTCPSRMPNVRVGYEERKRG